VSDATFVHPTASLDPRVTLGSGVQIGPYAVLLGAVTVGAHARIGAHTVVGGTPKIRGQGESSGVVRIGERVILSELCSVDAPSRESTELADDCYVMPNCYIGHDCKIGRSVTLSANCSLGGHVWIGERATLGLGCVVHQFSTLGALIMAGMASVINRDVPPFSLIRGNPARRFGVNRVGLQRAGMSADEVAAVDAALRAWEPGTPWPVDRTRGWVSEFEARSERRLIRSSTP
jgi:UDP-N-acetylglucosamine acyltransferase